MNRFLQFEANKPVLLFAFYWCFAAFSFGIATQETSLVLFILMGMVLSLTGNIAFSRPKAGHESGLVFFSIIIFSAIVAQINDGFQGETKIHWELVVFWALHASMVNRIRWVTLHRVLVVASIPGMLYSIYWLLRPDEIAWALKVGFSMYPRAFGFVSNPITNAEGLIIIACWTLSRLSCKTGKIEKRWLVFHLSVSLAIILASRVRAGVLGFALLLLLDAYLTPKRRKLCLVFLGVIAVGFVASIGIFGFNSASVRERMALNENSIRLFLEHPIIGIGPDRFEMREGESNSLGEHPHNTLLAIATETGVLGLIAFLVLMWSIGKRGIAVYQAHRESHDDRRWATQALIYVFFCFWVFGLFDFNFGDSELLILHGFHWAIMARLALPSQSSASEPAASHGS